MNTRSFVALLSIAATSLVAQQLAPPGPAAPAELTPERLAQFLKRYPEADTNKDGALTADEARAFRDKIRPQIQPQRKALPPPTRADVKYGPHERNVLDFWRADSDQPTPVLVFIHGGGFVAGDKRGVDPAALEACLSAKVSFASINYRYTTQSPYPAPMLDGARAIQFIRSKSAEWKIDSLRIGAFGGSAGAGISMWLGFHDDLAKAESSDPIERESSRLTCVGSIGGQSSYDPLQIKEWLGGRAWEHPAFKPFFHIESNEELEKPEVRKLAHDASVINHLTKDDAPVFMFYSEPDEPLSETAAPGTGIHHPKFGHILKEKMDALGIEAVYRHARDGKLPPGNRAMIDWLKEKLLSPVK
jgi:acetyl esterase/lipase